MARILIRDLPDDVLRAIDAAAGQAGLSRSEYIRRILSREMNNTTHHVAAENLVGFANTFADLDDDEVMGRAWS